MADDEAKKPQPCWAVKGCRITRCAAYGKDCECWKEPNAGYQFSFCQGSMRPGMKPHVCNRCPVKLASGS